MKRTFSWTSGGTWVCPANVTRIRVCGWGPGGNGGHSANTMGGGGGGGGAYAEVVLQTVVPGRTYQINASQGNYTKFYYGASTYLLADMGRDGGDGGDPDNPGDAGIAGLAENCIGDYGYMYNGSDGNMGAGFGADGGDAANGGGGGGTNPGQGGAAPGGGGAGGAKNGEGGNGADGQLNIDVYYNNEVLQTVVPT